jgi:hypothetical protein
MITLLPKLIDTTTCTEITFSDTTDTAYTGLYAVANINSSKLYVTPDCEETETISFDETQAQDLASQTETYIVEVEEESTVIKSEYIVFFTPPNETLFSITQNTDQLIVSGSEFDDYPDFTHVLIGTTVYKVKSIVVGVSTLTVTLTQNYTGTTIEDDPLIPGYSKTFYHAHVCSINKCLHSKIATVSTETCSCRDKAIDKLSKSLFMFFAIDVHMETANYNKAEEIINSLNLFCQSDKTCGC